MAERDTRHRFDPEQIVSETRSRLLRPGLVSAGFFVLVLVLFRLLYPLTAGLPESITVGGTARPINWGLVEGTASVLTLALVVGGLWFAVQEYIANTVDRERASAQDAFSIYREIFDRMMNDDATAARRWLIVNLPTLDDMRGDRRAWLDEVTRRLNEVPPGWTGERPPGVEHLKHVLNLFDFIGFVSTHYWSMEGELVKWMNPPIAKVWERVSVYVEQEARQRQEADYYIAARGLGDYCVQWRREQSLGSKFIQDAT